MKKMLCFDIGKMEKKKKRPVKKLLLSLDKISLKTNILQEKSQEIAMNERKKDL